MSSQRIRDIFEVATWVYGMRHYALMDEVILEAQPEDVLSHIEGLEIPAPLKLPLLLAWGEHYERRLNQVPEQQHDLRSPVRVIDPETIYASMHAITHAFRARVHTLSFVRMAPMMRRTWIYEATIPYVCATTVSPLLVPEGEMVPVAAYSHSVDRAQLLDRLIQVETVLAMQMGHAPL